MSYNPAQDLAACTEGTVEATVRTSTVRGWFRKTDQLILDAQGGRFQVETDNTVFDYASHLLSFKPSNSDTLTISGVVYPIDKAVVEGGGLMTKIYLGDGYVN